MKFHKVVTVIHVINAFSINNIMLLLKCVDIIICYYESKVA